jgi:hypothetical protein
VPLAEPKALEQAPEVPVGALLGRTDAAEGKQAKTAAELAELIEAGLAKHPHCPRKGLQVKVYGTTLWRAMLTNRPGSWAAPQSAGMAGSYRRTRRTAWRALRFTVALNRLTALPSHCGGRCSSLL